MNAVNEELLAALKRIAAVDAGGGFLSAVACQKLALAAITLAEQSPTPTEQPEQPWVAELERLARAATPGPWRGDRRDGTVKYDLLGADGSVVVHGDNGNASEYDEHFYGVTNDEDAAFIAAANPSTILKLIEAARLGSLPASPSVPTGDASGGAA